MKLLCFLVWTAGIGLGFANPYLSCFDYGLDEEKCESDPGNTNISTHCVFDGFCKCGVQTPTDVVFLLDRNDKTNAAADFEAQREWIAQSAESGALPMDSLLAVLYYTGETTTYLSLDASADMNNTERADFIRLLPFTSEDIESATGQAFIDALALFSAQGRAEADKVIVLLTTQPPWCWFCADDDPRANPCDLNDALDGIRVVAMLGNTIYSQWTDEGRDKLLCLDNSATDYVREYDGVIEGSWNLVVKPTINAGTCPVTSLRHNDECNDEPIDVVFVIDTSSSIDEEELFVALSWVSLWITDYIPANNSRIAFISFSAESEIIRDFIESAEGTRADSYVFAKLIDRIRGKTNVYAGVNDTVNLFASIEDSEAVRNRRLMVLMTDGRHNVGSPLPQLCDMKAQLEALDVYSYVLAIGNNHTADRNVGCIADEVVVVLNFTDVEFRNVTADINDMICSKPTTTPTTTTETPTSTTETPTSTTETPTSTTETPTSTTETPTSTTETPTTTTETPTSTTETPTTTTETPTSTTETPTSTTETPTSTTETPTTTTETPTSTTETPTSTTETPTSTTETPTSTTETPTTTTETPTTETPTTETPTTETPTTETPTTETPTTETPTTETPTTETPTTETPTTKTPTTETPTTETPTTETPTTETPTTETPTTETPTATVPTATVPTSITKMPTWNTGSGNCNGKETSFAYSSNITHDCFENIDAKVKRWGWSVPMGPLLVDESVVLYTVGGAAQCQLGPARCDGRIKVTRRADDYLEVKFIANSGVTFKNYHVWFGVDRMPKKKNGDYTVAPGQFFCKANALLPAGDTLRTLECRSPDDDFDYADMFYFIGHSESKGCAAGVGQGFCGDIFD